MKCIRKRTEIILIAHLQKITDFKSSQIIQEEKPVDTKTKTCQYKKQVSFVCCPEREGLDHYLFNRTRS